MNLATIRGYAIALGLAVLSGVIGVAILAASVFMTTYDGFLAIGMPVWFAVTCIITARLMQDAAPEYRPWSVVWAVSAGLLAGASVAGALGTIVALTWLLRLPYAAFFTFIITAATVFAFKRPGFRDEHGTALPG